MVVCCLRKPINNCLSVHNWWSQGYRSRLAGRLAVEVEQRPAKPTALWNYKFPHSFPFSGGGRSQVSMSLVLSFWFWTTISYIFFFMKLIFHVSLWGKQWGHWKSHALHPVCDRCLSNDDALLRKTYLVMENINLVHMWHSVISSNTVTISPAHLVELFVSVVGRFMLGRCVVNIPWNESLSCLGFVILVDQINIMSPTCINQIFQALQVVYLCWGIQ